MIIRVLAYLRETRRRSYMMRVFLILDCPPRVGGSSF